MLQQNVFRGFDLRIDRSRPQKRLVLGPEDHPLPFMAWSAGQREFVPLLLGFYWLMPPSKAKTRGTIEWVVLEELEMGLHPRDRSTSPDDDGTRVPWLPGLSIVSLPPGAGGPLGSPAFDCLPGISSQALLGVFERPGTDAAVAKVMANNAEETRQGLTDVSGNGRRASP